MPILVGIGSSISSNLPNAIDESLSMAMAPLQGHPVNLLLVFTSAIKHNQQQLLNTLRAKLPSTLVTGCSTSGEITSLTGPTDGSIALLAIWSDQMTFSVGKGENVARDSRVAGQSFAQHVMKSKKGEKPKAAIIFPDGLAGNGTDIVRGILDIYGEQFMLAGGSAGDDFQFKKTYQYLDSEVLSGSVVGIGMYGNFSIGIGVRHGWIPIGTSRVATKATSNILEQLDGKPAIQIYEDQFGKDKTPIDKNEPFAKLAITYPLGIVLPGQSEYLIRDPLKVSDDGSITCAAEIPVGSEVYIMIGSREEAINAAEDAAKRALLHLGSKKPKMALLFNCIARKKLLMNRKKDEIDIIRKTIGKDIPLIGFYTYGEQAPLGGEILTCSFHNETDVIFLLAE